MFLVHANTQCCVKDGLINNKLLFSGVVLPHYNEWSEFSFFVGQVGGVGVSFPGEREVFDSDGRTVRFVARDEGCVIGEWWLFGGGAGGAWL